METLAQAGGRRSRSVFLKWCAVRVARCAAAFSKNKKINTRSAITRTWDAVWTLPEIQQIKEMWAKSKQSLLDLSRDGNSRARDDLFFFFLENATKSIGM